MREPPTDLSDEALSAALRADYGLPIDRVTFLPLGHDANAWVYRADAEDGAAWFVKLRRQLTNEAALIVPHYLVEHGVTRVVAPMTTGAGTLSAKVATYVVIVYPYVSDQTGMHHGMTDAHWIEYGATLRQIHETPISGDLARLLRSESFAPDGAAAIERLTDHLTKTNLTGSGQLIIAQFWREHDSTIALVLERAVTLGARLAETEPTSVLCHADIHTNNVLVDGTEHIAVVDWDETMLAPRERDLMFVIGGIGPGFVTPREERLCLDGYGGYEIDPIALAYYRYAWAVSDIGSYGEQVFLRPDLGARDAQEAVDRFQSLFEPASIVDIALASQLGS